MPIAQRYRYRYHSPHRTEVGMNRKWNTVIQSLVLVRLGQELGSNTEAARLVHDLLGLLITAAAGFTR